MNKTSTRTPATPGTTNSIRVLKLGKCDSFSGKSRLTYQLGSKTGNDAYIRIAGNSGTGFYSSEWLSMDDVENICIKGKAITSWLLFPLFKCKSINTPAFLLAALYHEEVVQKGTKKKRTYEAAHPEYLRAEVKRLYAAGVNLEAGNAKKEVSAKAVPKPEAKSPAKAATAAPKAKPGTKKTPAPKAKKK
jgi:hypothetical protein